MGCSAEKRSRLGSPPRGRGKDSSGEPANGSIRITPAQAGKSLFCFTAAVPIQDHPRTGGERSGMKGMKSWKLGSPPHRRGKGIQADGAGAWAGITPAWAGKRVARGGSSSSSWDHPRTGGEKHNVFTLGSLVQGSPPRRRGKATLDGHVAQGHGITPAWAGKSDSPPVCG